MAISTELFNKLEEFDPKMKDLFLTLIREVEEKTKFITVARSDFDELRAVVKELAEAQKRTEQRVTELAEAQTRTEQRLDSLSVSMDELAQAQKRTEQRVTELAEAQTRTEQRLDSLTIRMDELAQAQMRTEQRLDSLSVSMDELAQAQKRTEQRVMELAEAQKRTEETLTDLLKDHKDVKKQLGGLSMDVGYGIEDRMMPHLKRFWKSRFGMDIGLVDRRNIFYTDGNYDEINLYCEGAKAGKRIFIIGEAKAQPGKKDFDAFSKKLDRLKTLLKGDIEAFMVGYHYSPAVESYADGRYPYIRRFKTFEITIDQN